MKKTQEKKALFINELVDKINKSEGIFLLRFEGVTVPEFIEFRKQIKSAGGEAKVVKNTLLRRALQAKGLDVGHWIKRALQALSFEELKPEHLLGEQFLLGCALQALSFEFEERVFRGPTMVVFAYKDAIQLAKVIAEEIKKSEKLMVKGCFYNMQYLPSERFKELASLPSRSELISTLIFLVLSPVRRVIGGIRGPQSKLVTLIYNIKKLKEEH